MGVVQRKLSKSFKEFFDGEKSSGILLIVCTIVSLIITNSLLGENYLKLWHLYVAGLSVEHWINDGLMAIFFLLIGLELKRELYVGELSNLKNALLPIFAAIGGVAFPALIHFSLNAGTPTQAGIGFRWRPTSLSRSALCQFWAIAFRLRSKFFSRLLPSLTT
jgi:NhaA family Na+:H+ antiporter